MLGLQNPGSDLGLSRGGRQISLEEERPTYNDRVSSRCRELKILQRGRAASSTAASAISALLRITWPTGFADVLKTGKSLAQWRSGRSSRVIDIQLPASEHGAFSYWAIMLERQFAAIHNVSHDGSVMYRRYQPRKRRTRTHPIIAGRRRGGDDPSPQPETKPRRPNARNDDRRNAC
jgi:hypothetical protein